MSSSVSEKMGYTDTKSSTLQDSQSETVSFSESKFDDTESIVEGSLLSYSEGEIIEHYSNLATSVIACFSTEFNSEDRVEKALKNTGLTRAG